MDKKQIFEEFSKFISIQSVSPDSKRRNEILKAVEFLKRELNILGFQINTFQKDNYPPLIIASYYLNNDRRQDNKTIGIYAHYDVQPEDPVEQWKTPPFKLTLKDGKFFGRGSADDKGHIIQTLVAIDRLIATKKLRNNLVLIFEGEEETGSAHFEELISKVKKELKKIDVFYMLDFGMKDKNTPEIFWGLRGLIAFELKVTVGKFDLHSGVYGNQVYNPIQILSELFAKIKNSRTRKILIPNFYDKARFLSKNNLWLSTKIHPSFDINGIIAGYTGEGTKTIIPASATAKFSFRLIEEQTPAEIETKVQKFVKDNLPKDVKFSLKTLAKLNPFFTSINDRYFKITKKIFEESFGRKPILTRCGGSIGAAAILQKLFHKPIILTGFPLPDENIHSPNENYNEEMFYKGIEAIKKLLSI